MGRNWLEGMVPYSEIWDTKPVGIIYIFGLIQKFLGEGIVMIRSVNAVFHGLCMFLVYRTVSGFKIKFSTHLTLLIVLLFFSLKTYSLPTNTEIFFITFTMLSFTVLQNAQSLLRHFIAGLILGFAFEIKYFVLFDYFAFIIYIALYGPKDNIKLSIKRFLVFSVGFVVPFLVILLYFFNSSAWQDFYNVTFVVPRHYSANFEFIAFKKFLLQFLKGHGLPLLIAIVVFLKYQVSGEQKKQNIFLASWITLTLLATIIPKTFFGHYQMQITLPVLILLISSLATLFNTLDDIKLKRVKIALTSLIILITLGITNNFYRKYIKDPEGITKIVTYLKQNIGVDDSLYVATSGYQILYYLLDKDVPTKYIHPSLLLKTQRATRLGINYKDEFSKIYGKKISYIVIIGTKKIPYMTNEELKNYQQIRQINLGGNANAYIFKRQRIAGLTNQL